MSKRIKLSCFKDTKETLQIVEILGGLRSLVIAFNISVTSGTLIMKAITTALHENRVWPLKTSYS